MPNENVSVTGVQENQRALKRAGDIDTEKAGQQAVDALIPYVAQETRIETGTLRGAWEAQRSAFINETSYAGYQEMGTEYVAPTHAIGKSLTKHGDLIDQAFDAEVEDAARKAGFNSI